MSPHRRAWARLDRALSTTLARVLAWVVIVGLGAAGLNYVQTDQQRACRAGNEFRQHDLPAAFAEFGNDLGERLLGERQPDGTFTVTLAQRAEIDAFTRHSQASLRDRFPPRDC